MLKTVEQRLNEMKWGQYYASEATLKIGKFTYAQPPIRQRVINNPVLYFFGSYKEITPEMELKWDTNNFSRVSDLVDVKMQSEGYDFKTALHKAQWQIAFSRPSVVIIYANGEFMDDVNNFINFFNLRGTTICYRDYRNGYEEVIKPTCNIYEDTLFNKCKIEDLDFSKLSESLLQGATQAADLLLKERERRMAQLYPAQNKTLYEFRQFYRILDVERLPEKIAYVDNMLFKELVQQAQEQLPQEYAPNLDPEDMTPELTESLYFELSLWAKPLDLDLPRIPQEISIDNLPKPQHWVKAQAPYAGGDILKPALGVNVSKRFTPEQQALYKAKFYNNSRVLAYKTELLKAYLQLQFYKNNPDMMEFLRSEYQLCPVCGVPVHFEAEACDFCGCNK